MIKILFIILVCVIGYGASASGVLSLEKGDNSSGAYAEIIKSSKEKNAKEKKNLIEPEYYVAPVGISSKNKSSGDTKPDRITHREVTSANTRRGDSTSRVDPFLDEHNTSSNQGSLHQKVIDRARGPNSMAESIRNNQHLNRSQYNKSGGMPSSPGIPQF